MPPASSCLVPPTPQGGRYYCPDFAYEETEVQKGLVTYSRSHRGVGGDKCAAGTGPTPEPSL